MWFSATDCTRCQSDGCDGTSSCRVGYTGNLCSQCFTSFYPPERSGQIECIPCGESAPYVPIFIVLGVILCAIMFAKLHSNPIVRELTIPLGIGASYLQIIAYVRLARLDWPVEVEQGMKLASISIFGVRAIGVTECIVSWSTVYWSVLASPFLILIPLAAARLTISYVYPAGTPAASESEQTIAVDSAANSDFMGVSDSISTSLSLRQSRCASVIIRAFATFDIHSPEECTLLIGQAFLSFLNFSFLFLSAQSLSIFDLQDIKGEQRIRENMQVAYGSSEWLSFLPGSVLGILLYIIGVPTLIHYVAHHPLAIFYLTSHLSALQPSHRWWISAQLVWKLAFAVILRLLTTEPTAQIVLCSFLLALRCGVVFFTKPYRGDALNTEETKLAVGTSIIFFCGLIFLVSRDSMAIGVRWWFIIVVYITLAGMAMVISAATYRTFKITREALKAAAVAMKNELTQNDAAPSTVKHPDAVTLQQPSQLVSTSASIESDFDAVPSSLPFSIFLSPASPEYPLSLTEQVAWMHHIRDTSSRMHSRASSVIAPVTHANHVPTNLIPDSDIEMLEVPSASPEVATAVKNGDDIQQTV